MLPELEIDPRRCKLTNLEGKYSMQLQTTTACNSSCIFCPHKSTWGKKPVKLMTDELIEKILNQMKDFTYYQISPYLQNEPLCDPRIFDILDQIKKMLKYDKICFSSNPLALTREKSNKLAEHLKDTPHEIRLSFHGVDSHSFETNMGIDYETSLKNTIYFLHVGNEYGLNVTVKGLGTKRGKIKVNAADFDEDDFMTFWKRICNEENLPFESFYFRYSGYHNRSANTDGVSSDAIARPDLTDFYCTRVDRWFHFSYNGELVLCCNDYCKEVILGDIRKNSISEIMESEIYKKVNQQVRGQAASEPNFLCKRCTSPGG